MEAKLACSKQLALFVIAMLTVSCAFETTSEEGDTTPQSSESAPVVNSAKPGGGNPCGPVLRTDLNGALYVEAYLCQLPQWPEPDPERIKPLENPSHRWVTVDTTSVAKPD